MEKEFNKTEDLKEYYTTIISKTTNLLKTNDLWTKQFDGYLDNPKWKKKTISKREAQNVWIKAYDKCIKQIENQTDLVFYISVQGTASLRYMGDGIIQIDSNSVLNSFGEKVKGAWNNTAASKEHMKRAGLEYSAEKIDLTSADLLQSLIVAFPRTDAVQDGVKYNDNGANAHENSFESRILEILDLDEKPENQIDPFFQNMKPIKRIIRHKAKNEEKREIGFYQLETPIGASGISDSISNLHYSNTPRGGIDLLLRRGKGNKGKTLTLVEIKDGYEVDKNEAPELVMGQLIAYATFICNLLDYNNGMIRWGKEFGYRNGYSKKELNCIVMMPLPDRASGPRTDFLNGMERLEVTTVFNKSYCLNLYYCFFDKNNITTGIITSLKPL